MSESIVKTEPAEEDDEENGRTTPVRKSVLEYELTLKAVSPNILDPSVIIKQETTQEVIKESNGHVGPEDTAAESTVPQERTDVMESCAAFANNDTETRIATPQSRDASEKQQPASSVTQNSNIETLSKNYTAGVLVKDEPQDPTDLENTIARLDAETNNEMDNRATPPPPTLSISSLPLNDSIIPPPPQISNPIEPIADTAPVHLSPEAIGVMVKEELQNREFSELEEAISQLENKANITANELTDNPSPPPPKISTMLLMRLRVKSEFSATPPETEYSSLPKDFFEGILTENIVSRPMLEIQPKDEPIPDNFFDDLLVDKVQERIEEAETQDLEVKYGDRLKQLEELKQLVQNKEREKRKHKKSKKKSRKRQRTPSPTRRHDSRSPARRRDSRSPTKRRDSRSPARRRASRSPIRKRASRSPIRKRASRSPIRRRASRSPSLEPVKHKLMRWPEKSGRDDWMELPSTSKRKRSHKETDELETDLRAKLDHIRRNTEVSTMKVDDKPLSKIRNPVGDIEILDEPSKDSVQPHLPEIRDDFTPKQKRDRILLRAKTLITHLNTAETEKDNPLSTFLYTSIVRKLPSSHSYRNQHVYENRSPLHNINNVSYKFNSHARRFNMEEWGLASLPPLAANIAKLVGYDALAIHNKLKVIKVPAKLRKIKTEVGLDDEDENKDESLRARSSLFCSASTQTDEMVDILKRKPKGYDIGIQAVQPAFEIGCQTLETESPSIQQFDNNDDLPIMGIMRELNENQLMALHDFAELLKEPASNAMDMYRLRQRMLDIYKCSQLPSAMALPTPIASVNNYSSNEQQLALRIQSAAGADGSCFSVSDPRLNFTDRRNRDTDNDEVIRNANPHDPRNSQFSRYQDDPRRQYNEPPQNRRQLKQHPITQQRNQPPSNAPKFYGRGGLRR